MLTEVEAICNAREIREGKCALCTHGKQIFKDDNKVFSCENKLNKSRRFWYRNFRENCGFKEDVDAPQEP